MNLTTLLNNASEQGASDVHLVQGEPPIFRISGKLERQSAEPAVTPTDFTDALLPLLTEAARLGLEDGSLSSADGIVARSSGPHSFTLKIFRSQGGLTANLRALPNEIPTLELVGGDALEALERIASLRSGLTIFSGPTGSGKQTTASSVVDRINRTRAERIFVIEEMPGYQWTNRQSIVTTLQIGRDFDSYDRAAQMLLRGADPDIILFNDLPTLDAVRQALTLADNGHMVVAVMPAESAVEAIAQIARSLPEPRDVSRVVFARSLAAVFGQRLLPRASGSGRLPLYEYLFPSPQIREIIRAGANESDLTTAMQESADGARTRGAAIDRLLAQGEISEEAAARSRRG